jgi:hypothetical protein
MLKRAFLRANQRVHESASEGKESPWVRRRREERRRTQLRACVTSGQGRRWLAHVACLILSQPTQCRQAQSTHLSRVNIQSKSRMGLNDIAHII